MIHSINYSQQITAIVPGSMRRWSLRLAAILAFAMASFGGFSLGKADDVEILFDNMSNLNYTGFSLNSSIGGTGSNLEDDSFASFGPDVLTGNFAPSFSIVHQHNVNRDLGGAPLNGDGTTFLQSSFTQETLTYTPVIDGEFSTISFSLDVNFPGGAGPTAFDQIFFSLRDQNFLSAGGFTNITGQSGWQTITVSGLTAADFGDNHSFSGPLELSFGFGFTSSGDVTAGAESLAIGVDNFRVSISAVPEPASLLLLSSMAIGVIARYRKRKAKSERQDKLYQHS